MKPTPREAKLIHEKYDKVVKHLIDEKYAVDKDAADKILKDLEKTPLVLENITKKERKRNPSAPFITSSLQQEASRKLNFSPKKTMMLAQKLYEGIKLEKKGTVGLITYMKDTAKNTFHQNPIPTKVKNLHKRRMRQFVLQM